MAENELIPRKVRWTRLARIKFKYRHGYSWTAHYATGGLRRDVLRRDNFQCVQCGMTDQEHKGKWGRPITVDHKNKNRKDNRMDNLQTLCLRCHGRKDLIPSLKIQRVPRFKQEILSRRSNGESYRSIADLLGFSIAAIWKWAKRWETTV